MTNPQIPQQPQQAYNQPPPQQMPPNYQAPNVLPHPPQYVVQAKSRFVAAALAFFFGTFGVHNFYLGYNGRGLIQLVSGVLGWLTVILLVGLLLLIPLGVWVFVEFLMILLAKEGSYARSANGVPLA